ncbi:DinB family protein [Thalassobacillus pellis]|uniref:DinB family protein n=1 Tax=Thalassobacillus pellis TaxID=748008 RepID=UPI00196123AE|nr:DinB family protein [Thalassobacillus pellis]MBM7553964.1 putative damage-inducible protein DinB [Thalassobacillus pellis]
MNYLQDVLADQLSANANEKSWYVPFSEAVKDLTEEEAFWKADENSNSIGEIVHHLIHWNKTWQKRYSESSVYAYPSVENNDETFYIEENKQFDELQNKLLETLLYWQELLNENQLKSDVKGFSDTKWWEVLASVTTHNAYHIGQIIYIRKMQKSWR